MHVPRNIQSGYVAADFWAQHDSTTPRMALFVLVTPRAEFGGSSAAIGFTSNTRDMVLPGHSGIIFKSSPAITPTVIESSLDDAANMEITGVYNSDSFLHSDVMAGKWDFAEIEVFTACWDNLDLGEFVRFTGNTGEFKDYQTYFTVECRGFLARLSNDTNKITSALCRCVRFGDDECKKDLDDTVSIDGTDYNITQTLTVASVVSVYQIVFTKLSGDANNVPDNFFADGEITALGSTANGSLKREMLSSDTQSSTIVVNLKRRFPFAVSVGQQFTLVAGCDRTLESCVQFENVINRRAEDFVPGIEASNRVGSAN